MIYILYTLDDRRWGVAGLVDDEEVAKQWVRKGFADGYRRYQGYPLNIIK